MKLVKIRIKFEIVNVYPFYFLSDWFCILKQSFQYWKLKHKFNQLKWDSDDVWKMTCHDGCLKSAVETLCYKLTKNTRLFPKLRKLIYSGFDRDWE